MVKDMAANENQQQSKEIQQQYKETEQLNKEIQQQNKEVQQQNKEVQQQNNAVQQQNNATIKPPIIRARLVLPHKPKRRTQADVANVDAQTHSETTNIQQHQTEQQQHQTEQQLQHRHRHRHRQPEPSQTTTDINTSKQLDKHDGAGDHHNKPQEAQQHIPQTQSRQVPHQQHQPTIPPQQHEQQQHYQQHQPHQQQQQQQPPPPQQQQLPTREDDLIVQSMEDVCPSDIKLQHDRDQQQQQQHQRQQQQEKQHNNHNQHQHQQQQQLLLLPQQQQQHHQLEQKQHVKATDVFMNKPNENNDDEEDLTEYNILTLNLLSSWATWHDAVACPVGLTEIALFEENGKKIELSAENVLVDGEWCTSIAKVINNMSQTTNFRNMWKTTLGDNGEPVGLSFMVPINYSLHVIKIWNYNCPNSESMGVRNAQVLLNDVLLWSGEVPKAPGRRGENFAFEINLSNDMFNNHNSQQSADIPHELGWFTKVLGESPSGVDSVSSRSTQLSTKPPTPTTTMTTSTQPSTKTPTTSTSKSTTTPPVPPVPAPILSTSPTTTTPATTTTTTQRSSRQGSRHSVSRPTSRSTSRSTSRPVSGPTSRPKIVSSMEVTARYNQNINKTNTITSNKLTTDNSNTAISNTDRANRGRTENSPINSSSSSTRNTANPTTNNHTYNRSNNSSHNDATNNHTYNRSNKSSHNDDDKNNTSTNTNANIEITRDWSSRAAAESPMFVRKTASTIRNNNNDGDDDSVPSSVSDLEKSWESLRAFKGNHRGRLGSDSEEPTQNHIASNRMESTPDSQFPIPTLPKGLELVFEIKSNWGDRHYVGLTGIEMYDRVGNEITSFESVCGDDLNQVHGNTSDPRVASNLFDQINLTKDEIHMWLAPYCKGTTTKITVRLREPCTLAMMRIYNYNTSRTHSFRGVRQLQVLFDGTKIFDGEIRQAPGSLQFNDVAAFGELVLFTVSPSILRKIAAVDRALLAERVANPDVDADSELPNRPNTRELGGRTNNNNNNNNINSNNNNNNSNTNTTNNNNTTTASQPVIPPHVQQRQQHTLSSQHTLPTQQQLSSKHQALPSRQHALSSKPKPEGASRRGRRVSFGLVSSWGDATNVGLTALMVLGRSLEPLQLHRHHTPSSNNPKNANTTKHTNTTKNTTNNGTTDDNSNNSNSKTTSASANTTHITNNNNETNNNNTTTNSGVIGHRDHVHHDPIAHFLQHNIYATTNAEHMWLVQLPTSAEALPCVEYDFGEDVEIRGFRIHNYNNKEFADCGVQRIHVKIDEQLVSPANGFLVRKGPGHCRFDYGQTIEIDDGLVHTQATAAMGAVFPQELLNKLSLGYSPPFEPIAMYIELRLLSTWGDQFYIGLDGLELLSPNGLRVAPPSSVHAYPPDINVLPDVEGDPRVLSNILRLSGGGGGGGGVGGGNGKARPLGGAHAWLTAFTSSETVTVHLLYDTPVIIGAVKLWNYSKTQQRGVRQFQLLLDDRVAYEGQLTPADKTTSFDRLLFTDPSKLDDDDDDDDGVFNMTPRPQHRHLQQQHQQQQHQHQLHRQQQQQQQQQPPPLHRGGVDVVPVTLDHTSMVNNGKSMTAKPF